MFVLGPAGRLLRLASELSLVVILARSGLIATADRYDYIRGSVDKFLDRPAIGQPKKLGS
jgi:hypothetical protein